MSTETKAWGRVHHVFDNDRAAVSVLHVEKGGYSSRHFHRHRVNRFVVVSGSIDVVLYSPTPSHHELVRTRLQAGDVYDVTSNVVHRFEVVESGIVVEVYWPDARLSAEDIERLDVGGMR